MGACPGRQATCHTAQYEGCNDIEQIGRQVYYFSHFGGKKMMIRCVFPERKGEPHECYAPKASQESFTGSKTGKRPGYASYKCSAPPDTGSPFCGEAYDRDEKDG